MDSRSKLKNKKMMKKRTQDYDYDVISNLPINVKDTILTCLPLREAVRTSILSKKWRYSWTSIPKLVFDGTICEVPSGGQLHFRHKLISIINQIMLFHQGTILKFSLSHPVLKSCPEIDHLVFFLSKNGLEELSLQFGWDDLYKLPLSFFTCQELKYLKLSHYVLSPPPAFKGFHKLISLEVDFVTFISNCPRPSLINQEKGKASRFDEFFGWMPAIEKLTADLALLLHLARGGVPTKLPNSINLKILILSGFSFDALDEVSCLYALISSSPGIQRIQIRVLPHKDADATPVLEFLNTVNYSDIILEKLQEVQLMRVSGIEPELKFIELLLAKSPMLDTMLIKPDCHDDNVLLKKMARFQRASPMAKILFE